MKKLIALAALLCAATFAKEYEYMLQSTTHENLEGVKKSRRIDQIYDAKERRLELITDVNSSDGLKSKYKEVSYFGESDGLAKFETYEYDFKKSEWQRTSDYKATLRNGIVTRESNALTEGGYIGVSKSVSRRDGNISEEMRYKLVGGKWEKSTLTKSMEDERGNVIFIANFRWDGKTWRPKDKTKMFFDAKGRLLGYESFAFENGTWRNRERELIAGDLNDKYERLRSIFIDGAWQSVEMTKHEIDVLGGMEIVTNFLRNSETNAWENRRKDVVAVRGADFNATMFLWSKERNEWVQEYANSSIYDESGERLIEQSYYAKSGSGRYLYDYDEQDSRVVMDVYKPSADGEWEHKERSEFVFDKSVAAQSVGYGASMVPFEIPSKYAIVSLKRFKVAEGKFKLVEEQTWRYKKIK